MQASAGSVIQQTIYKQTNKTVTAMKTNAKVGDTIKITAMRGESQYTGRTGTVEYIDDRGQLHGTWGGLAVIPEEDEYIII